MILNSVKMVISADFFMQTMVKFILFTAIFSIAHCSNITNIVFSNIRDGMPAAFGDFNSDELTDIFVLRNEKKTVEIFLAAEEEPLLRPSNMKCDFLDPITSVVPGDFNGDAFMDILVTTARYNELENSVHIIWGGLDHINCSNNEKPIVKLKGQPLVLDYNLDMIMDIFGIDEEGKRMFWIFNNTTKSPEKHEMNSTDRAELRHPHSHAVIDLNNDFMADLFLTTKKNFEIWNGVEDSEFVHHKVIDLPKDAKWIGQSLFIDVELVGRIDLMVPVCFDNNCKNSAILVHAHDKWHDLQVNFKDNNNVIWHFVKPNRELYSDAITLRSGDFNMDGYPDMLVTLTDGSRTQAVLLENVACVTGCSNFSRTYTVRWRALDPFFNSTVMAVFYDFYQDGVLDVIVVQKNISAIDGFSVGAFRNTLDYDANFIKIMVLTGLTNKKSPTVIGRLGKKKRTYGTNLPGPRISYRTTTQDGYARHAVSSQLPQSAHFSLGLPYTIFGLGRTPNFVDSLTVGLANHSRDWPQIIPNSQMVVIPWPVKQSSKWRAQLFVTPSKLILMSVAALTAVCGIITVIIAALYWRERKEDRRERLQESHRFHFDAM